MMLQKMGAEIRRGKGGNGKKKNQIDQKRLTTGRFFMPKQIPRRSP
jgi:hypothetical protein